jgi:hypothetical protein
LLVAGVYVGIEHLWLAGNAWFVEQGEKSVAVWVFTVAGPLSTLPAAITAFFRPQVGAAWLIGGGILSSIASGMESDVRTAMQFFPSYGGPMLALGLALLFGSKSIPEIRTEKEKSVKIHSG